MLEQLVYLLFLSAATASITLIVTRSSLFKPFRALLRPKRFWYDLITCPFCFSVWVAFFITILCPILKISTLAVIGYFIEWFAVVALAAPMMNIIFNAIAGIEVHED
jgi:hypothetical protein